MNQMDELFYLEGVKLILYQNLLRKHRFSPWVLQWLTRRAEEGLSTISRIGVDATFKVIHLCKAPNLAQLFHQLRGNLFV